MLAIGIARVAEEAEVAGSDEIRQPEAEVEAAGGGGHKAEAEAAGGCRRQRRPELEAEVGERWRGSGWLVRCNPATRACQIDIPLYSHPRGRKSTNG